jgi:hypothetical protein
MPASRGLIAGRAQWAAQPLINPSIQPLGGVERFAPEFVKFRTAAYHAKLAQRLLGDRDTPAADIFLGALVRKKLECQR